MQLNYFTVDDATYAYTMDGHGETLVLLHGFTGSSTTWESYIKDGKKSFKLLRLICLATGKQFAKRQDRWRSFVKMSIISLLIYSGKKFIYWAIPWVAVRHYRLRYYIRNIFAHLY